MKVYIATRNYDYEGSANIGVFASYEEAKQECERDKERGYGDSHSVEQWELGKRKFDESTDFRR